MAGTIEIFPKQFVGSGVTQPISAAVDTRGANFGSLQVWIDRVLVSSPAEKVKIAVQHANSNDDPSYLDVTDGSSVWEYEFDSTTSAVSLTHILTWSAGFGQFLRLKISLTNLSGINVRAVLVLKDSV